MLKGSWWSFWNGSTEPEAICALWAYLWVFYQRSTDEPLLCLCVYFLRGSTGHCIQGLSFRPYWWDLILTTSEIALSHFTRMTQITLLSFCCISGSCRVRAAEAWIVTLANCLWPDTAPTLPVTLWELLFQTCRTHDHAVLCCPSWNLYKFDMNLWGRGTSSWAVSI